jgi:hypothetical protein
MYVEAALVDRAGSRVSRTRAVTGDEPILVTECNYRTARQSGTPQAQSTAVGVAAFHTKAAVFGKPPCREMHQVLRRDSEARQSSPVSKEMVPLCRVILVDSMDGSAHEDMSCVALTVVDACSRPARTGSAGCMRPVAAPLDSE